MAIMEQYTSIAQDRFETVKAVVLDALRPHEAHAARYFAHPNAARVWRGRFRTVPVRISIR